MAAILNGLTVHGGLRAYGGTFLVFSDYMKHSVRLAALMKTPTIFVFTHDSIGLGEDGPTHQPVEQVAGLRAIPNLAVFRPADAAETLASWKAALRRKDGPSALILTRQGAPDLPVPATEQDVTRGAYVVADHEDPEVLLLATGSEVQVALGAQALLGERKIGARVVSMPCWSCFEDQPDSYKDEILPANVRTRISVEALASLGWERYVGLEGAVIGLDQFGASAPYKELFEAYGFTPEAVAEVAQELLTSSG
jgi:transketolase